MKPKPVVAPGIVADRRIAGRPPFFFTLYTGDGNMTTTTVVPGNTAETFLTHIFGRGLEGDRYVVERFRRVTATLKTVRELRPAPNEIIICTALNLKRSGIQYWGSISTGLFCDRRQKG